MSFGTVARFKTKKALAEAVKEYGADKVQVFDTSGFNNRGTIPISQLESKDVIVGPDVYNRRIWTANAKTDKSGTVKIV